MVNSEDLKNLLAAIQSGELTVDAGLDQLQAVGAYSMAQSAELCLDTGRATRCGLPEVVYGPGKSGDALVTAFRTLNEAGQPCLATRVSAEQAAAVRSEFPDLIANDLARTIRLPRPVREDVSQTKPSGKVCVVSAGTSDRPVAEEALETLLWAECDAELILDIGVAGPQRLKNVDRLREAVAIVVVAGMNTRWRRSLLDMSPARLFGANERWLRSLVRRSFCTAINAQQRKGANVAVVNIDAGSGSWIPGALVARKAEISNKQLADPAPNGPARASAPGRSPGWCRRQPQRGGPNAIVIRGTAGASRIIRIVNSGRARGWRDLSLRA